MTVGICPADDVVDDVIAAYDAALIAADDVIAAYATALIAAVNATSATADAVIVIGGWGACP